MIFDNFVAAYFFGPPCTLEADATPEYGVGLFLLTQYNQIHKYLVLSRTVNCVPLTILMLTFNSGKTGTAEFINRNLKETASAVQQ